MRVLVHASGFDTGGQGTRIREAFAQHEPTWHVDALSIMANPFGYPDQYAKIGGIKRRLLVPELYRMADVVHLRNSLHGLIPRQDKPLILHHHGSAFRMTHARLAREAEKAGAVQVASTLDLTLLEPDVEWCPAPYNLTELALLREQQQRVGRQAGVPEDRAIKQMGDRLQVESGERGAHSVEVPHAQVLADVGRHSPDPGPVSGAGVKLDGALNGPLDSILVHAGDRIRIAHFPTNPKIKSSPAVKAAVEGLGVQFVHNLDAKARTTRRIAWPDVLRLKATSDIYVDQLILGYGNNAVEAWAMGLPVVAGVADRTVREVMLDRFGQLPFVEATVDTLPAVLRRLVESPAMREEYGAIGRAHVERWHSGAETVAVLRDAYQRAGLRQLRAVA